MIPVTHLHTLSFTPLSCRARMSSGHWVHSCQVGYHIGHYKMMDILENKILFLVNVHLIHNRPMPSQPRAHFRRSRGYGRARVPGPAFIYASHMALFLTARAKSALLLGQ